jgi:hypothetical protein
MFDLEDVCMFQTRKLCYVLCKRFVYYSTRVMQRGVYTCRTSEHR